MQSPRRILRRTKCLTPRQINQLNRRFWRTRSKLMNEQITDPALYEIAMKNLNSEQLRAVPVKSQNTLEQALADAAESKTTIQRFFSWKGGKQAKPDALQRVIEKIVKKKPSTTGHELLRELPDAEWAGTVTKIDKKGEVLARVVMIHFVEENETPKVAPVSGLKDRLSRAKKKILSR
jgi:hypothetical protein